MLVLEATELLLRLVKLFLDIIVVTFQATRLLLRLLQAAVKLFDVLILSLESLTQSLVLFRCHFLCLGRRRAYAIAWLCREDLILEGDTDDYSNTDPNKCFCHILVFSFSYYLAREGSQILILLLYCLDLSLVLRLFLFLLHL